MKNYGWLLVLALLTTCKASSDTRIVGRWSIEDRFCAATYEIVYEKSKLVGRVLSYDDGTSRYTWNTNRPMYIFEDLERQGESFVNGLSGATAQRPLHQLDLVHEDTLLVTTPLGEATLSEVWIRNQ